MTKIEALEQLLHDLQSWNDRSTFDKDTTPEDVAIEVMKFVTKAEEALDKGE